MSNVQNGDVISLKEMLRDNWGNAFPLVKGEVRRNNLAASENYLMDHIVKSTLWILQVVNQLGRRSQIIWGEERGRRAALEKSNFTAI